MYVIVTLETATETATMGYPVPDEMTGEMMLAQITATLPDDTFIVAAHIL